MKPHLGARADIKRNILRVNDHQIEGYIQEICKYKRNTNFMPSAHT